MKTHKVLDLMYLPEEGQGCFTGTLEDCNNFISKQTVSTMYEVVTLSKEEVEFVNG